MQGNRSILGLMCIMATISIAMPTNAVGQNSLSCTGSGTPTVTALTPNAATPRKDKQLVKVDCSGTLYAAAFCSRLCEFINASDSLNSDETLNLAAAAVGGTTQKLLRPDTSPLWILALAPSAAVNNTAKAYAGALIAWESARLDKQKGAAQTAAASTDVVAKPGASGLLSLATESGAFASTVNGSSVTLNGNVWNAFHLMTTGSLYPEGICSSNCVNPLRTTNVIATFTVGQSNSTTAATSGTANSGTQNIASVILPTSSARLSSITTRWNFWHSLDPASTKFQSEWHTALEKQRKVLADAGNALDIATGDLTKKAKITDPSDPVFPVLRAGIMLQLAADYKAQNPKRLVQDYESFLERFFAQCRKNAPEDFDAAIVATSTSLATFEELNQQVIDTARGIPILTAEYTFSRPASQPSTHDLRLIVAESWKTGAQLTANLAASIYNSVPTGAAYGRLKDVQLSAELDQAVGNKLTPPLILSLAGYGQYQWDPSILNITPANLAPGTNILLPPNAQQFLGTSGWLGIVQAKATIQLQKSISIPLAVKWSNKTDLLNAQDIRGQFGISYDFSSLVSFLKGQ